MPNEHPAAHDEIQPRFWRLLEAAFPSKDRLIAALDALPRQELVAFVIHVEAARWEVREEWEGPFIDDNIGHLSEDGTQNLTDWIVSQGEAFWRGTCSASDGVLRDLFFEHEDAAHDEAHPRHWVGGGGTLSPWCSASASYRRRFGEGLLDEVEALRERLAAEGLKQK
jgi:hypothetical protein